MFVVPLAWLIADYNFTRVSRPLLPDVNLEPCHELIWTMQAKPPLVRLDSPVHRCQGDAATDGGRIQGAQSLSSRYRRPIGNPKHGFAPRDLAVLAYEHTLTVLGVPPRLVDPLLTSPSGFCGLMSCFGKFHPETLRARHEPALKDCGTTVVHRLSIGGEDF